MDWITQVAERLRATGGRMTTQRRLILETLAQCTDHPTAEEIYQRARQRAPDLNLSTVYRTLRWLEDLGVVGTQRFEGERPQERFDPAVSAQPEHHHFRCRLCNTIIEFPAPLLEVLKQDFITHYGGTIESASLIFYGLCESCLQKVETYGPLSFNPNAITDPHERPSHSTSRAS